MVRIIVMTSYAMSVLSFLLFLYFATRRPPEPTLADSPATPLSDIARVLEALAKLTDSFAKAGPTVMSLVASIFFLLIAVMASGLAQVSAAA